MVHGELCDHVSHNGMLCSADVVTADELVLPTKSDFINNTQLYRCRRWIQIF